MKKHDSTNNSREHDFEKIKAKTLIEDSQILSKEKEETLTKKDKEDLKSRIMASLEWMVGFTNYYDKALENLKRYRSLLMKKVKNRESQRYPFLISIYSVALICSQLKGVPRS